MIKRRSLCRGTQVGSCFAAAIALFGVHDAGADSGNHYLVHGLVSDGAIAADHTDPNLVNSWGLARSPSSPWWVADNGTDKATLYDSKGEPQPPASPLVVDVPGGPTGAVFNPGSGFVVQDSIHSGPAVFLFATEAGTILGWSPRVFANRAVVAVDSSGDSSSCGEDGNPVEGAVYKGLAISGERLYATDFHNNRVDVFDRDFQLVRDPDAFVDPRLPAGFAPFGIQALRGRIYVSYAKQDSAAHDDVAGPGNGFIDAFELDGTLARRIASRGPLNSPWGMVIAPANFGRFSDLLLVGNFGDGHITAYLPEGSRPRGQLDDGGGKPIIIDGLWGLGFGNGGAAGPENTLFFTSGPDGESHGLFGLIRAVP